MGPTSRCGILCAEGECPVKSSAPYLPRCSSCGTAKLSPSLPWKLSARRASSARRRCAAPVKATAEPAGEEKPAAPKAAAASPAPKMILKKKPAYSMKKGQIVRVEKEKYPNCIHYLSVGHPPFYKGLHYIYEDRGEVLDIRIFETGEYGLLDKLDYREYDGLMDAPKGNFYSQLHTYFYLDRLCT